MTLDKGESAQKESIKSLVDNGVSMVKLKGYFGKIHVVLCKK